MEIEVLEIREDQQQHAIAVAATAALTVASWFKWSRRFSLRTLLIPTTLVAMGLGIVAVMN